MGSQMKNKIKILAKVFLFSIVFCILTLLLFVVYCIRADMQPSAMQGQVSIQEYWRDIWWERYVDDCQQIGNTIIAALELYHADHSRYPDDLSELCPRYLPSIPEHLVGDRQWEYFSSSSPYSSSSPENVSFSLTFRPYQFFNFNFREYTYVSESKTWKLEDL